VPVPSLLPLKPAIVIVRPCPELIGGEVIEQPPSKKTLSYRMAGGFEPDDAGARAVLFLGYKPPRPADHSHPLKEAMTGFVLPQLNEGKVNVKPDGI